MSMTAYGNWMWIVHLAGIIVIGVPCSILCFRFQSEKLVPILGFCVGAVAWTLFCLRIWP